MAPDLNSLPPSRSPTIPTSSSPTTATIPATAPTQPPHCPTPRHPPSPRFPRRRSGRLGSFSLMDSSGNSSPTTSSFPHHHRAPSLGELHQELENEQEAQVNRLLGMIREQQAQIATLQQSTSSTSTPSTTEPSSASLPTLGAGTLPSAALPIRSRTPSSSRPASIALPHPPTHNPGTTPVITATSAAARASPSLSRGSSRRSRTSSHASERFAAAPGERERDDVSLWQAETAMVQRENQMLKGRIRELERLIDAMGRGGGSGSGSGGGDGHNCG